jgi:HEAT repeat protein/cyclophilin family peptidyl-prolyl cis-trans isomerase
MVLLARGKVLLPLALALLAAACGRSDPEENLRRIRRWEDSRTLPADSLTHLLETGAPRLRAAAARAMGRIGDPAALRPLAKALESDRRPEVRGEAAFGLGLLGVAEAAPHLVRRLTAETHTWALGEVALALGRLENPPAGAADALVPLLKHGHPHVREQVLESLALLADSTTTAPLVQATFDPITSVAWRAAYALEKIPRGLQVPRLIELTRSPESLIRRYAIRSLGRLEAEEGIRAVVEALSSATHDWQVRVMAADALGRIGGEAAIAPLGQALHDASFHVRVAALSALARLEKPSHVDRMRELTEDPAVDVRLAAYAALAACAGADAAGDLERGVADPHDGVAGLCLARLGETGSPSAPDVLMAAFDANSRPGLRYRALEGLGALEQAPRERIRAAVTDEDWIVATTAVAQIARLQDTEAVPLLLRAYDERKEPGRADVCWQILQALGELGDERAVERLRRALEEEDDVRLRLAARASLAAILPETEAAGLRSERDLRADVRPVRRSPRQPALVVTSGARQLILKTDHGHIYVDLLGEEAPQTVESFARLAERGFFDDLTIHRVVPNFVIQGGDPTGTGWGDAGYTLRSEWHPGRYERGTVGIAHAGKDTGSCQFFITHSPQPHLNARYTILGRVSRGMEVVDRIQMGDRVRAQVHWSAPRTP